MFMKTLACAVLLTVGLSTAAFADECEASHDPSPESNQSTGISFYNDTPYAFKVLWIGFDGFNNDYGLVQPGESASFDTYVGHQWMVEIYAPDRTECFGPVSANSEETCQAHMLWQDGIGIDGGFCDF